MEYVLDLIHRKGVFMDEYYHTLTTTVGIDDIAAGTTLASEKYHSVDGVETASPAAGGIYIKSEVYSDGTVKNSKVFVK